MEVGAGQLLRQSAHLLQKLRKLSSVGVLDDHHAAGLAAVILNSVHSGLSQTEVADDILVVQSIGQLVFLPREHQLVLLILLQSVGPASVLSLVHSGREARLDHTNQQEFVNHQKVFLYYYKIYPTYSI